MAKTDLKMKINIKIRDYKEKHLKILKLFLGGRGAGQLFVDFHFWPGVVEPNP
jgi:hypothetical protein